MDIFASPRRLLRHAGLLGALLLGLTVFPAAAQDYFTPSITSNRNPSGWEHNMLFNAPERFNVTQSGPATFDVNRLFDGRGNPSYTEDGLNPSTPTVITITGFDPHYRQGGIWVGWTTRYWPAKRFKIEAYDVKNGYDDWRVIADYSSTNYSGHDFAASIGPNGVYSKIRFTFYEGSDGHYGSNGHRRVGVSELFYINSETGRPYQGLLPSSMWEVDGNVGIGVRNPGTDRLAVKGTVRAQEVIVTQSGWADYVFADDYALMPLPELRSFIDANRHLPGIPTAQDVERDGARVGETQTQLLAKIEELTLYTLDQQDELDAQQREIDTLKTLVRQQQAQLQRLLDARGQLNTRDQEDKSQDEASPRRNAPDGI